jgi:hypothetical protein
MVNLVKQNRVYFLSFGFIKYICVCEVYLGESDQRSVIRSDFANASVGNIAHLLIELLAENYEQRGVENDAAESPHRHSIARRSA